MSVCLYVCLPSLLFTYQLGTPSCLSVCRQTDPGVVFLCFLCGELFSCLTYLLGWRWTALISSSGIVSRSISCAATCSRSPVTFEVLPTSNTSRSVLRGQNS
ncbi:hypothetical protein F5B22DRAFT_629409 [Xylaria bambusicola]|uniref:uncharacterized protein n=1 Tax=Xylaria bambusicola TaxID=326684 RepID=UPI0020079DA2|nr:uncharacterized protein F5B22DRAFT_629409 [Xylaria bambusicola]KAI0503349.1 hypothetical protein F5B22DRAFT_629409 [Xylaria bambusicola]